MNRYKAMIYFGCVLVVFLVIEIIAGIYNKHSSDNYLTISGSSPVEEVEEEVEDIIKTPNTSEELKNVNYEPVKIIIHKTGSIGITQYGEVVMLN